MSFSIDKEGVVDFTFLFNKEDQFRLSNDYVSDGKYQLSPRRLEGKIMVEKGDINYYAGRNLLLGVFNNEDEAVQINIKFEDYSIIQNCSYFIFF